MTYEQMILAVYHEEGTYRDIAAKYGIGKSTVSRIKNGQVWASLTGHVIPWLLTN